MKIREQLICFFVGLHPFIWCMWRSLLLTVNKVLLKKKKGTFLLTLLLFAFGKGTVFKILEKQAR